MVLTQRLRLVWRRKRQLVAIAILLALPLIIAYWRAQIGRPQPGGPNWRTTQADPVREEVIRWQIGRHRLRDEICFVSVSEEPLVNTAFARRFASEPYIQPVTDSDLRAPGSPMLLSSKRSNGFTEAATGKPALRFTLRELKWSSDTEVEVDGSGASALMSGDFGTFIVVWTDGKWQVKEYRPLGQM